VVEESDTLTVYPSKLHGAEIETYNDHRMGDVFCGSGLEGARHQNQETRVRQEDVPELFPETGRAAAEWPGRDDSGREDGRKLELKELFAD